MKIRSDIFIEASDVTVVHTQSESEYKWISNRVLVKIYDGRSISTQITALELSLGVEHLAIIEEIAQRLRTLKEADRIPDGVSAV